MSESADTNGEQPIRRLNDLESITRVLGAFDLQQFWPKSDLFLEYLGGGAFYSNPYEVKQLQAAGLEAVTRWRTGQATLRDAFSYLPDGSFEIGPLAACRGWVWPPAVAWARERRAAVCPAATFRQRSVRRGRKHSSAREHGDSRCRAGHQSASPRSPWRADSATLISTIPTGIRSDQQ